MNDHKILNSLIQHGKIDPKYHDRLVNHNNDYIKREALRELKFSDADFEKHYNNPSFEIKDSIIRNPHLPEHLVNHAIDETPHSPINLNNGLKPHHLLKLLDKFPDKSGSNFDISNVAAHRNANKDVLDKILSRQNLLPYRGDAGVSILDNPHHTKEHINKIVNSSQRNHQDIGGYVGSAMLRSPHLTKEHLETLSKNAGGLTVVAYSAKQKLKEMNPNE